MYSNSRYVVTYKILTVKTDFFKMSFFTLTFKDECALKENLSIVKIYI